MYNSIPNNLIQYFGNNTFNALKFIRNLSKNINNSKNVLNAIVTSDKIEGYSIGIYSLTGLVNNPKELIISSSKKYYLRYFINIYNELNHQFYGNTYRSPLFPVEVRKDNKIELLVKNPFFFYVLSQEPKYENLIVQIILVEANQDDIILKEKCQGWAQLRLIKKNENQESKKNERIIAEINKGTPRDLILSNSKKLNYMPNGIIEYIPYKYPKLELIKFLFPLNIILAYNEPLPGLLQRYLPENPNLNETLKPVEFYTAFLKNIILEINPDLEEHIIEFGKKYRFNKYNIEENELNKIAIKERRIKCGMHNTWKFINSNGLQNSITLTKISKTTLQSNGVLMIDKFFSDHLSCSAVIMELEYVITISINGPQKEDNLNLILGYHIYVPEKINEGNYSREKLLMFTGPGSTIYGEKMWYSEKKEDRNIRISYILSQNSNLNYINQVEISEEDKKRINATQNALVDQNNQMILKGVQQNNSNETNSYYKNKVEDLTKQLDKEREEVENYKLKMRNREAIWNNAGISTIKDINNNIEWDKTQTNNINNIPVIEPKPKEEKKIKKEETAEYKEFIKFKERKEVYIKELEEKIEILKDIQKPKVSEYEMPVKNITQRDKSYLIKKGIMDLVLKEQVESYIDKALEEELCKDGLATNFTFQFMSFKPSRAYYSDLRNVPQKIQFSLDFFNENKLRTPVCNIVRPEETKSNNHYYFNNPLILKKENIDMNSALLNDTKPEVILEVRYDPSLDTSINFRDFVKYLINKRLIVQIKDVQKGFNVGVIKIPLNDLIEKGKEKIQKEKEYEIYDDNFNIRGYIQVLIAASKYKTLRPYNYNMDKFYNINSQEGYNTLSKKKKVKAEQIDINKLTSQNKTLYNLTMNSLKNQNNNNQDNNLIKDTNQNRLRKLRIEPEIEKKIRVMRYFNMKNNNMINNKMSNTNYSLGNKIQQEEKKLNDLKQKQASDEQFFNTLKTCEQIREFNRTEILSKVSQESHKNTYNITLISGQPVYFNYSVFNDSSLDELCHISIDKVTHNKKDNNNFNIKKNKIVDVISTPIEWRTIVEKEKLKKPNSYEAISDQLDMIIKPGETIPLVIKLLSYIENREEENYGVTIHKKNGQPLYYLSINIKRVFPIFDHIFHYYFPLDNSQKKVILRNPFGHIKTMKMLNNVLITDKNITLGLDEDTHDFYFMIEQEQGDFVIFFYSDEERTKLYLTWKFEIDWLETDIRKVIRGKKEPSTLYISNNPEINKEASYAGSNITLQLFTNYPDVIIFPHDSRNPFTVKPNTTEVKKYMIYSRRDEENSAIINCVNVYTRNIYKSWLIKYEIDWPHIDESETVECIIGNKNEFTYRYKNPMSKFMVLTFYSGNEDIFEVFDRVVTFNGEESKDIKFQIHDKGIQGKEEVLLFVSDDNEDFCRTILFKIIFK